MIIAVRIEKIEVILLQKVACLSSLEFYIHTHTHIHHYINCPLNLVMSKSMQKRFEEDEEKV